MQLSPISIAPDRLDRIARRVEDAELGYAPDDDAGWKYGVDRRWLLELREYWLGSYDWRAAEARFNEMPGYMAEIDGVPIHFFHLKGKGDGYPLILTHGWPGSVTEFLEAAPLLVEQGYDVVLPSLPGYGFSGRPPRPIGPRTTAAIFRKLMTDVLGYARFGAQGGDWGSMVTQALGRDHGDVVASIHLNMLHHTPNGTPNAELGEYLQKVGTLMMRDGAYSMIHATRPQTIGLVLGDSPLGYAGWVIEKCRAWSDCGDDVESVFSKDTLLTNVMTYLVTGNAQAGVWMYNGQASEPINRDRIEVPSGFAEFPAEFLPPPPRWATEQDMNLVRWNTMPAGGHFGAWEQPRAFAEEVGSFFREWR